MKKKQHVVVVDYGIGNLFSVSKALEACGNVEVIVTGDTKKIHEADKLILPGVGAFSKGIEALKNRGLEESLSLFVAQGKPLLGICLGMQLLASFSEEQVFSEGLNYIAGSVLPINRKAPDGEIRKVPSIGWYSLHAPADVDWRDTVLGSVNSRESAYFVHSYCFHPNEEKNILAYYYLNGEPITAAVRSGNIYGTQFHPEKSGYMGLKILGDFLQL